VTFLWPEALWLLLALPVLVAAYVVVLRRRKKAALRYATLSLVKDAMGAGHQLRRHIAPALFLVALTALLVAIARPAGLVSLPSQYRTIILVMDVSGSMRAADVEPSRLAAAQAAAKTFVADVPSDTRIGVVSFAGTAAVAQAPTANRDDVLTAIDRFQLQRGTAIGSGIIVALATIFPDAGIDERSLVQRRGRDSRRAAPRDQGRAGGEQELKPVPPGSHASAAIILLTDGQRTTGPDALDAAQLAADRGVRIFTVGIGTTGGQVLGFEGWSMRVRLDEGVLKEIANATRGEYFYAGSAADLKKVYRALNARVVIEKKKTEITALVAAAGAVTAVLSVFLSLLWFNRVL
jgi:Ca-activated chloride channel family protein